MEVTADVAEADAASVKIGQVAAVTFSATSTTVSGRVTAVALQGTTTSNVVEYPVTVALDSVPPTARPGASVSIVITTGSRSNVLALSSSAVTTLGNTHTVTVLRNGTKQVVPVTIGLVGNSTTQIVSGLSEGDVVVIPTTTTTSTTGGFPGLGGGGLGTSLRGAGR
jgi:hypothetical protein